jgi:hypothetical protein
MEKMHMVIKSRASLRLAVVSLVLAMCVNVWSALLRCPECNRDVSSFAEKCLGCGCPVSAMMKKDIESNVSESESLPIDNPDFQSIKNSLFLVKTDLSAGTAFLVELDGRVWLLTNRHVLLGAGSITARDSSGTPIRLGQLEVCDDRDLARFLIEKTSRPALTLEQNEPTIGDSVTVCGNSEGADLVAQVLGKVNGVGPTEIEVDAGFVSGNSGSPILNDKGRVIGVATYVTYGARGDASLLGTRFAGVRRFGLRVADNMKWRPTSLALARREVERIIDAITYVKTASSLIRIGWAQKGWSPYAHPAGNRRSWAESARNNFEIKSADYASSELFFDDNWAKPLKQFRSAMAKHIFACRAYTENSSAVQRARESVFAAASGVGRFPVKEFSSYKWSVSCYSELAKLLLQHIESWREQWIPRERGNASNRLPSKEEIDQQRLWRGY